MWESRQGLQIPSHKINRLQWSNEEKWLFLPPITYCKFHSINYYYQTLGFELF